jgi:hypothetical protein
MYEKETCLISARDASLCDLYLRFVVGSNPVRASAGETALAAGCFSYPDAG